MKIVFFIIINNLLQTSSNPFFPQVVANAVAALSEISDVSSTAAEALELNSQTVNKLCTALNECTEYVL